MPDNDPNPINQPHEADPANEAEVDRILAEAAGFADDLEGQIGDDRDAPSADGRQPDTAEDDGPVNVDSQLDHVERLLRGLEVEADIAPPRPVVKGPADNAIPDEQPSAPDELARPDDMSTRDEPPPDGPGQDLPPTGDLSIGTSVKSHGPPANSLEGLDEELAASVLPDLADSPTIGDPSSRQKAATSEADSSDTSVGRRSDWRARLLGGHGPATQIAVVGIERTLAMLDSLDHMFAWISYDVRRVIGWVALALLVAACSIMAFSIS